MRHRRNHVLSVDHEAGGLDVAQPLVGRHDEVVADVRRPVCRNVRTVCQLETSLCCFGSCLTPLASPGPRFQSNQCSSDCVASTTKTTPLWRHHWPTSASGSTLPDCEATASPQSTVNFCDGVRRTDLAFWATQHMKENIPLVSKS